MIMHNYLANSLRCITLKSSSQHKANAKPQTNTVIVVATLEPNQATQRVPNPYTQTNIPTKQIKPIIVSLMLSIIVFIWYLTGFVQLEIIIRPVTQKGNSILTKIINDPNNILDQVIQCTFDVMATCIFTTLNDVVDRQIIFNILDSSFEYSIGVPF